MSRCVTLRDTLEEAGRISLRPLLGANCVAEALRARPTEARRVLAIGKAAWAMAEGAFAALATRGGRFDAALVVCKEPPPIELPPPAVVLLADHPRPGPRSVVATTAALRFCAETGPDQELLVLLSGGTSALLGGPVAGTTLAEIAARTEALLRSGVDITAINAERRRLGAALGGRLARATPARAITALVLSDVLGDDLRTIGSGPLHGDPIDPRVDARVIAGPRDLLQSAVDELEARGFAVRARAGFVSGEVSTLVDELAVAAERLAPGTCFVAVGEPTLRVTGRGRGGRATHTALLLAERLRGTRDLAALALASDGSDGPTDLAGAVVSSETAAVADARGISIEEAALRFDSATVMEAIGAALRTGPTGTNLTDLYVVARAG